MVESSQKSEGKRKTDPIRQGVVEANIVLQVGSHHEAHIHVRDIGYKYEASIRISDGEIIAGYLPRKLAKLAKKVFSDQIYFYKCWNTMTDGLHVDINKHYGYIKY